VIAAFLSTEFRQESTTPGLHARSTTGAAIESTVGLLWRRRRISNVVHHWRRELRRCRDISERIVIPRPPSRPRAGKWLRSRPYTLANFYFPSIHVVSPVRAKHNSLCSR
jgi:hypothetical protein